LIDPKALKAAQQIFNFKSTKISVWDYYQIGKELFHYRKQFASSKIYGQNLKTYWPEIHHLSPAVRSNCIWLYRVIEKEIDIDLLPILGVKAIEDLHTSNPSVIRNLYRTQKRQQNSPTV
jgi:hypothetical protein